MYDAIFLIFVMITVMTLISPEWCSETLAPVDEKVPAKVQG